MFIETNISSFVVFSNETIQNALIKIENNKHGVLIVISQNGMIDGILTDGDFRRWLLKTTDKNLNLEVIHVANRNYLSFSDSTDLSLVSKNFSDRIKIIPLVDKFNRISSILFPNSKKIQIGEKRIGENEPTFIIAEVGNNHNGSYDLALELVDSAVLARADCVKFQIRDLKSAYANKGMGSDHAEDLGSQYVLDLLNKFQLSHEQYANIFDYCKSRNILPLCTPWDQNSLSFLAEYGLEAFKIASADMTNHDLLKFAAKFNKPLICSTGMSTEFEIVQTVNFLNDLGVNFALLHCNSTYPTPFKDINLRYMDRLKEIHMGPVGYSGHERGINIAVAAVARGCHIIEKHLTKDKNMEGNDHKVSLLPSEFKAMVDGIRQVELSLGVEQSRIMSQGELMNREILGKSLVLNTNLNQGDVITEEMLSAKSPGKGIPVYKKSEVVGRRILNNKYIGDILYSADVFENFSGPKKYCFSRPFGIPVRYHDFNKFQDVSNFDFFEFHLSYKDLDLSPSKYLLNKSNKGVMVHAPELFEGDHILDLCSDDDDYLKRSIFELQRVINLSKEIAEFFKIDDKVKIVTNVGGHDSDGFFNEAQKNIKYEKLIRNLGKLNCDGVEILPQSMPPFPWHFGGQRYHNLFVTPQDIVGFCSKYNMRICLDTSHSKLASNFWKFSFSDFIRQVSQFIGHIHVSDASGLDGEGLQILEGEIDFKELSNLLNKYCSSTPFIPEVWQGHKNYGEGFWVALDRLESFSF